MPASITPYSVTLLCAWAVPAVAARMAMVNSFLFKGFSERVKGFYSCGSGALYGRSHGPAATLSTDHLMNVTALSSDEYVVLMPQSLPRDRATGYAERARHSIALRNMHMK
ncbi:hypothetical protein BVI434_100011 [Burkholderia vietnamiensis]|nr:hypothetical protein BVI434_100011 [Burkholderia vietnamiensis]CAG9227561.1 hypothetical protein BVI1335_680010 [Burkholderia vietnamiensis]